MRHGTRTVILLAAAGAACAGSGDARPVDGAADAPIAVQVAPVTDTTLARPIVVAGTVAAREEVTLAFTTGGPLATLTVDEGDVVRAGQTLATLAVDKTEATVTQTRAAAEKAERDVARARRLHADSVVTLAQLEDAETAVQVARAGLRAAALDRRYARIVAPFDGVVLSRSADVGQIVAGGAPVLSVGSRGGGVLVRASVTDRDVSAIQLGDPAMVRFDAIGGADVQGNVVRIAAAADAATGTYLVEIALRGGPALRNGMIGAAAIRPRQGVPTKLVPLAAVLEADGAAGTVYALSTDGRQAERRRVRLGAIDGARVAVLAGLDDVSRVVTGGAAYLPERARVRVTP
jgi:RND family efflux transporter MFP subunit